MVSFIPQITSTIVFTNLQNSKTPSGLGKEYILDFIKPLWLSIELDTIFPLYGDTEFYTILTSLNTFTIIYTLGYPNPIPNYFTQHLDGGLLFIQRIFPLIVIFTTIHFHFL